MNGIQSILRLATLYNVSIVATNIFLLLAAFPANAANLTWTLNNVNFFGTGSFSGSFDYDASTNIYSAPNITYQNNDPEGVSTIFNQVLSSEALDFYNQPFLSPTSSFVAFGIPTSYSYPRYYHLSLSFSTPLTNNGGNVTLNSCCSNSLISSATAPSYLGAINYGYISSGSVSAVVSDPSNIAASLFIFATLGGFTSYRLRKKQ